MDSGTDTRALPRVGFPIRTSRDQGLVSTSPGLFAAAHVLHRLLAPRHPPCALRLLIMKNTVLPLWSFQGARRKPVAPVSQNSTAWNAEVDVLLGELGHRTARRPSTGRATYRGNGPGIPRKEVIQPQLPLRLPCYDFVPITNPTFDGSLPCGLGHRLRVLPAFVT
jgi:hypothetical protein